MRISVFGLGYVGAVSLACLARDGHQVIGVDIDRSKLDLLRQGQTPVIEAGMSELIARAVASGRVEVTDDAAVAVQRTDLSFICVGTPSRPNGSQNLAALERLCTELGAALCNKTAYHCFVVRSTVAPGTVDGVITPLLERFSGKTCGDGFDVCFQPEFLREGSSIRDYDNPPFVVLGARSERAVSLVREVFGHLPCDFMVSTIPTAEMLKYACNTFHALKITFANEIGRVCQSLAIDSHAVMNLVCRDRRLNISDAYLRPGFAFGGSCLPKDLRAVRHLARQRDVDVPMLDAIADSNDGHLDHAIDFVLQSGQRAVGMLGLSFKSGTDDLRESPLVAMAERFIGKGLTLGIYDPDVSLSRLVGANRRYIEEIIPHIGSLMCDEPGPLIERSDLLVVGLRTPAILDELRSRCRADHVILDLVNIPDRSTLKGVYRGVCW